MNWLQLFGGGGVPSTAGAQPPAIPGGPLATGPGGTMTNGWPTMITNQTGALPPPSGSTSLVPYSVRPPVAASGPSGHQGLIRDILKGALGKAGLLGNLPGLFGSPQNTPAVADQLRSQFASAGRAGDAPPAGASALPPHVPFAQSNIGQMLFGQPASAASAPYTGDYGWGNSDPFGGGSAPPSAPAVDPAAAPAASPAGTPMPRPRPQAAPWVNPDAANNFYNGPGSSSFGAGDPTMGPQGQNFNVGSLSRFFGS